MTFDDENNRLPDEMGPVFQPMQQDIPRHFFDEEEDWTVFQQGIRAQHDMNVRRNEQLLRKLAVREQQQEYVNEFEMTVKVPRVLLSERSIVGLRVRIVRPPAGRLLECARFLMTRRAFDTIVAPVIADGRHEYYEAWQRLAHRHARYIVVRMYFLVLFNTLWGIVSSVIKIATKKGA